MDVFFYVSLFCVFVSFLFIYLQMLSYKTNPWSGSGSRTLPPGRNGWPFIGESLEFLSNGWKGHPEKFFSDRIVRYSSNIFRTHLLGERVAVFCYGSGNKFLFSNENKLVQLWLPSNFTKVFPPPTTQTSCNEEAIKLRKMLLNFLKPEALKCHLGVMDHIAQRHFADKWENKNEIITFPLTKNYTLRIACRLFVSNEDLADVDKFARPFNLLAAGLIAIPIDLPGTQFNKAIKASNIVRNELVSIVKQRKIDLEEGKASPTQDILSHMLLTTDENGKFMHELNIATMILGLLVASSDAISSACTSVVKYLAELPQIYDGVYKEQMEIVKSKTPGELLNWDDVQKMKYSWNVACEVLRLGPPAQGGFREATADFVINGFSIPKGWKLYWSARSTHTNPEVFPDPMKFDPSRFEGSGPAPYTFVPFGGGPRMCPGKEYVRLEILVFMHHLVKRFRFEKMIPDEKIIVNPTPNPEKGLPVRLIPHEA